MQALVMNQMHLMVSKCYCVAICYLSMMTKIYNILFIFLQKNKTQSKNRKIITFTKSNNKKYPNTVYSYIIIIKKIAYTNNMIKTLIS